MDAGCSGENEKFRTFFIYNVVDKKHARNSTSNMAVMSDISSSQKWCNIYGI